MSKRYEDKSISVEPMPIKSGGKVQLNYHGILKTDGASEVFLHYGFDGWKDCSTVKMDHTSDGSFTISVHASADQEVNFCFKDSAGHWDNNNGWNWQCDVD